jgi:hypothetical protein
MDAAHGLAMKAFQTFNNQAESLVEHNLGQRPGDNTIFNILPTIKFI